MIGGSAGGLTALQHMAAGLSAGLPASVLSGGLNDGTHRLQIIKRRGGIAVAQRLEEAIVPHMPLSAVRNVVLDHIGGAADMAALIVDLSTRRLRGRGTDGRGGAGWDVAKRGSRKLEAWRARRRAGTVCGPGMRRRVVGKTRTGGAPN